VNAGVALAVHTFVAGLTESTAGLLVSTLITLAVDAPELPARSEQFTYQLLLPWLKEALAVMVVVVLLTAELLVPIGAPATKRVQDEVELNASA
jgi:hypothetical protein